MAASEKRDGVFKQLLLWVTLGWLLLIMNGCSARLQSAKEQTTTVFAPDAVYKSTRIPALVYTKRGSLLAFCEGRIGTASDWADMNLIMRRSIDGGRSWAPIVIIDSMKGGPVGNPTPIVDANGIIHLLYQRDYAEGFYTFSEDDGKTWAKPVNITATYNAFRPEYNWKVLAPGPGHGIQLQNGRLLSAVWLANSSKQNRAEVIPPPAWLLFTAMIMAKHGNGALLSQTARRPLRIPMKACRCSWRMEPC